MRTPKHNLFHSERIRTGNEQNIGSHKLCRQWAFTTPMAPQGRLSHKAPSNTMQETEVCFHSRPHASSLVNMEKRCGIFRLASTDKEAKYGKRDGQWKKLTRERQTRIGMRECNTSRWPQQLCDTNEVWKLCQCCDHSIRSKRKHHGSQMESGYQKGLHWQRMASKHPQMQHHSTQKKLS